MQETRNIIDYYAYWKTDAIKADLDSKRHDFSVLVTNDFGDFNLGTVIRCANAFLAKEVIIYGKKQYDRRGTVGTHLYENLKHVKTVEELNFPSNSLIIGIDNIPEAKSIENYIWDKNQHTILVFGQEQMGISPEVKAVCHDFVFIKQYGSVRSLNVGVAAGIAMYDYMSKLYG